MRHTYKRAVVAEGQRLVAEGGDVGAKPRTGQSSRRWKRAAIQSRKAASVPSVFVAWQLNAHSLHRQRQRRKITESTAVRKTSRQSHFRFPNEVKTLWHKRHSFTGAETLCCTFSKDRDTTVRTNPIHIGAEGIRDAPRRIGWPTRQCEK